MHNITWHLARFQLLYPDLHHLQRLRFFSCIGQCATWSYLTSLTGGLVILYFFGGGDSMSAADGLPTALFLLANDSANIAWNLRRGKGFWLSSLQSLLYKNQELTTVIVKVWKKMYKYHGFDFNNLLYNEHIMTRRSTPPILALYSLTMAGLLMWSFFYIPLHLTGWFQSNIRRNQCYRFVVKPSNQDDVPVLLVYTTHGSSTLLLKISLGY